LHRGAHETTTTVVDNTFLDVFVDLGLVERNEPVWHPSFIDFVVCGEKYVEKECKVAGLKENPDIANVDPASSVLDRVPHMWSWLPKRYPSFLDQKILEIDIIFRTLRKSRRRNV
jgi:hypothetical protein